MKTLFVIVALCVAVVILAQQTKILCDTHNMSDDEFVKYIKDNKLY